MIRLRQQSYQIIKYPVIYFESCADKSKYPRRSCILIRSSWILSFYRFDTVIVYTNFPYLIIRVMFIMWSGKYGELFISHSVTIVLAGGKAQMKELPIIIMYLCTINVSLSDKCPNKLYKSRRVRFPDSHASHSSAPSQAMTISGSYPISQWLGFLILDKKIAYKSLTFLVILHLA